MFFIVSTFIKASFMVHGLEQIQKPRQRGVQSEKSPFRGFNESLKNLEMAEGSIRLKSFIHARF